NCLKAVLAEAQEEGIADKSANELFVPAPMMRTYVQSNERGDAQGDLEIPVSFEQLISDDDNVIVYAPPEFGRSTLLREIQIRLLRDAKIIEFPRLPLRLEFAEIKNNLATLLRQVRAAVPAQSQPFNVEALLRLGHASLLFDDVDFADAK